LTTDKDGKITVDNLKPGKYSFIEIKAPEGYKLNSNPIAFEIVMSQKDVAKVTAKNELEKVPTDPKNPEDPKEPAKPADPIVPDKNKPDESLNTTGKKIKETIDSVINIMNPKTGDPGVLGYVAVMAVAGIGLVATKKKK
ncbi:prealbumin-like fold domain-containing protein, partial [Clostridium sp.]|uniref:prealbumin-like fold domain-containing protein n=1 Tax=Clostridium sp. TaxID=1506 RepID=UPI002FCC5EA7